MDDLHTVLFDIDGTLLDTRAFILQAFLHSLKHNFPTRSFLEEEITAVVGKPLDECYRILTHHSDVSAFCEAHRLFQQHNLHLALAFPHTKQTLQSLSNQGKKIAAVTTRTTDNVAKTLQLAGIFDFFSVIITGDDVRNHKPDPEGLYKALSLLGCSVQHAVMIGDTDADILAGKNAGTKTIGVTYGFSGQKLQITHPDFLVSDILDILPILLQETPSSMKYQERE